MNVSVSPSNAGIPKWTVMVYSAADNNLKPYMLDDIREIESVGSDSYTNLVAQVDEGGSVGASRYLLQKGGKAEASVTSPPVEKMGDVNMADPKMLADFIAWGQKNYPAEHYMLIISDHGGGWKGAIEDDSKGGWATTPMLAQGLALAEEQTGRKLDVLGFDACLMASTEVMNEIGKHADYIVASEQTEGADGWPYTRLLNQDLVSNMQQMQMMKINVDPRELATLAVKSAAASQTVLPTMTAIDTANLPAVYTAVDQMGKAILATNTPNATLKQIMNSTQSFTGFKDAVDFANRVESSDKIKDPALKEAAKSVRDAVAGAVIAEEHSARYPNAHGLTLEMSTYGVPSGYSELEFAKTTSWPAALDKIGK